MYKKLDFCPSCKHSIFDNLHIAKDHLVSGESFAIVQCQMCHLLFTNPRPSDSRLPHYYESDDYVSHNDNKNSLLDFVYRVVRQVTLRQKLKSIKKYHTSGSLLDFGAGTGAFLQKAGADFDVIGVEPSSNAVDHAPVSIKTRIYENLSSYKSEQKFDVVTMWHVLEHLPNLGASFREIKDRLSKKGHLFIAVPNPNSWDSNYYGTHWAGYDVPRHLYHFSKKAMDTFLKPYGLRILETKPMTFDAYYVSMLSERHLNNPYSFMRGLYIGYRSNKSAYTSQQYSSLLYVIGA